jgi:hypothetical protein
VPPKPKELLITVSGSGWLGVEARGRCRTPVGLAHADGRRNAANRDGLVAMIASMASGTERVICPFDDETHALVAEATESRRTRPRRCGASRCHAR